MEETFSERLQRLQSFGNLKEGKGKKKEKNLDKELEETLEDLEDEMNKFEKEFEKEIKNQKVDYFLEEDVFYKEDSKDSQEDL